LLKWQRKGVRWAPSFPVPEGRRNVAIISGHVAACRKKCVGGRLLGKTMKQSEEKRRVILLFNEREEKKKGGRRTRRALLISREGIKKGGRKKKLRRAIGRHPPRKSEAGIGREDQPQQLSIIKRKREGKKKKSGHNSWSGRVSERGRLVAGRLPTKGRDPI